MVVNSIAFLCFFLVVLVAYYLCQRKTGLQNTFLLLCSYWFYAQVSLHMALLLAGLTAVFWTLGKAVDRSLADGRGQRASWLTSLSVVLGVGALFYFKYLNFFAESFVTAASWVGLHLSWTAVKIFVPVGLSFFSFKLMSYVLDIYHGKMRHEQQWMLFANYIAFFPTILSGPIDRPRPFIKQLKVARNYQYEALCAGFRRVLWGMFMKMCVADRLDIYISAVLGNYSHHSALSIVFATLLYPLQMYADFGGYSEMAIGTAQMLGIKVAENFKRPFLAINVADYWRRWHMSLTSWLTDYVFMPCNIRLRDWGVWGTITAIMLNMLFVGLWHGANWTFFFFGLYHGLLFVPLMLSGQFFRKQKVRFSPRGWPTASFVSRMAGTYLLVTLGQLIFRSPSMTEFLGILAHIPQNLSGGLFLDMSTLTNAALCLAALVYVDIQEEWFPQYRLPLPRLCERWRWELTVVAVIVAILLFGVFDANQFIYFQF